MATKKASVMNAEKSKAVKRIQILPREPLTNKARRSIEQYVLIQGRRKGEYMYVLVKATLEAERMRRSDLYAWLEKQGLIWRNGYWILKTEGDGFPF